MVAYRLHFDDANLRAVEVANSGEIGEPRIFNSVFSQQVKDRDIRVQKALGGGTIEDMGIYCINAARYLFRDEPIEVTAFAGNNGERRFREIEEMMSCTLRFPGDRLANFTASFGASSNEFYSLTGTKGSLFMKPAYTYAKQRVMTVTVGEKERQETFPQHDQFGAELQYFSDCVLNDREPEPNGDEGFADVRIIRALRESVRTGRCVQLPAYSRDVRPDRSQEIRFSAVEEPELVHASGPDGSK
jgi:glucose-fructose oxidoreductase